jgi:hypothetical protein
MAANGISTLATKQLKQEAKLDLAATDRAAAGNARANYDIDLLPTKYDDDGIVDNENVGGLVVGRPWILVGATGFTLTDESGNTLTTESGDILTTENGA